MNRRLPVYGLDIETDTHIDGLDPSLSSVRCAVLSFAEHDEVFAGRESTVLSRLDTRLRSLPSGLVATWNGALFDLPFLVARARQLRIELGLRLVPHGPPLDGFPAMDGHPGAHRAAWHHHGHVDTHRLYGDEIAMPRQSPSRLLRLAQRLGRAPAVTDAVGTDALRREVTHACAARDARLARVLAERRGSLATRLVDRVPQQPATAAVVGPSRTQAPVPVAT